MGSAGLSDSGGNDFHHSLRWFTRPFELHDKYPSNYHTLEAKCEYVKVYESEVSEADPEKIGE